MDNPTANLTVSGISHQYPISDDFNRPLFISQQDDHALLLSNSPSLDHLSLSNTPSLETPVTPYSEWNEKCLPAPTALNMRTSINFAERPSEHLEEIEFNELNKLKAELNRTKYELSEMAESHNDEIDNFQVMVKKMKTQSHCVQKIKESKQRNSMKQIRTEYEGELEKINKKLMITQNLHISEIRKLKKSEIRHGLEMKLKDKKIKELNEEIDEVIASKHRMKNDHDAFLEEMKKKYDDEMEQEVNKRISRISQLTKAKNKLFDELRSRQSAMIEMDEEIEIVDKNDEKDQIINILKKEIKRLEKNNEKDQDMFFKHNQIFEHKLERETKEKNGIEHKFKALKDLNQKETKELNDKIIKLKQELSQQYDVNVHLQQSLEMISEQNIRYKQMESDYHLFAAHIDEDYDAMNAKMEALDTQNKQKEGELNKLRSSVNAQSETVKDLQSMITRKEIEVDSKKEELDKLKECMVVKVNETESLRVSVNAHSETIKELQSMITRKEIEVDSKEEELGKMKGFMLDKANENMELRTSVNAHNETIKELQVMLKEKDESVLDQIDEDEEYGEHGFHRYSISHLSVTVEDDVRLEHEEEMESLKVEYKILINDLQSERDLLSTKLEKTKTMLRDVENSKVVLLGNFVEEMDRMRAEIKKQNALKLRC